MKKILLFLTIVSSLIAYSQNAKAPIYPSCEETNYHELEQCFLENIKDDFLKEFHVPENVKANNFNGKITTYFGVNTKGEYTIHYINTHFISVKKEIQRVFNTLPKVIPAKYNGNAVESDYFLPFYIPLENNFKKDSTAIDTVSPKKKIEKTNIQTVIIDKDLNQFPELNTSLSIPFTHDQYSLIDKYGNRLENEHATVKPYFYNETDAYKNVAQDKTALFYKTQSVLNKKIFNDNLIYVKGNDYWFSLNPIVDFQLGKDNSDIEYTYNNTRAINARGSIGKFSFSTSLYESQGRFANYVNRYIKTLKPANGYTVMLGSGNAKKFKDGGFDYPVAEGYVSYKANKHFTLQFGNGKNFIGDGYRSLFLSDVAAPYTFAKISTQFWKIKYTNIWMWLNDVRPNSFINDTYLRKFVATHHLSINITKKWNLGLFESTVTNAKSNPNMDVNFVNPIIFYRAVEFARGSKSGNAMVGLNTKYKFKNANIYAQFVLDEITVKEFFKSDGYWANKYGLQLGFHYYDLFNINNLNIQGEANIVRPFTYSHRNSELNYSHYYQPLAHPWGSNFVELIGIARYQKDRWYANFKAIYGKKGFDFTNNEISYGGDIFKSYNDRGNKYNHKFYQGNTANIFIADVQFGYIVNPTTNLHLFLNAKLRNFNSIETIPYFSDTTTNWFSIGLKTDVFNRYFDF